jgi:DNA-binding NtrC family response regulator
LENVVHSGLLTARDGVIRPANLRFSTTTLAPGAPAGAATADPFDVIAAQLDRLFAAPPPALHQRLEELIVRRGFAHAAGNQLQAARLLGVSRNILRTLLKRFGLIAAA